MMANKNRIWEFFERKTSTAVCKICVKELSLGSSSPKKQTFSSLRCHLKRSHIEEWLEYDAARTQDREAAGKAEQGKFEIEHAIYLPVSMPNRQSIKREIYKDNTHTKTKIFKRAIEILEESKDSPEIYGKAWAAEFRQLNEEQKIYAKRAIDEVLFHGRLGNLNQTSSVSHTPDKGVPEYYEPELSAISDEEQPKVNSPSTIDC